MSNFYTLLTRLGAALHANAQVNQTTVPWTHMRLGDGNGAPITPTENQTGLARQVHVLPITDIAVHPDNPNWVIAEAVVPSDVGGWTVREAAIYGGAGGNTCIAVGNYPETYKPVLAEGAGREMVMRMVVQISSVATVKMEIDPAVAIASRAWVESLVATPDKAGLVKLATEAEHIESQEDKKAASPKGVEAMLRPMKQSAQQLQDRVQVLESGSSSLTKNGYKIHADGLIEQWGVIENVSLSEVFHTVTFPMPFPEEVFNASCSLAMTTRINGTIAPMIQKGQITLSSMKVAGDHTDTGGTGDIYWRAKGK